MLKLNRGLCGLTLILASSTAIAQGRAAAPDGDAGEILATHVCPIHGYVLHITRPAGYPPGASERVIQVEKMNMHFHAIWNEVSTLVDNHPPNNIDYHQLPQNPGADGERYCVRTGHMIPTDTNVYQVSLAHANNYNGSTSVFADNNLELAPLINVIQSYNTHRDQGDPLPPTCNYGCLDDSGAVPNDPDDGFDPDRYTSAEGVQEQWDFLNPDDDDEGGNTVGGTVRPGVDARIERERSEEPAPAPGSVTPVRPQTRELQIQRQRNR